MTISVVIADDQPLMRSALRTCLDDEPGVRVVGEAGDGARAVQLAELLRPCVVVMDIRMPVMDGVEATRRIAALDGEPPVRVLVMTTFDLDEHIVGALRAGASGFLVKDSSPDELIHAVQVIAAGQALLSPAVTRRLLDLRAHSMAPVVPATGDAALARTTTRERAVLRLVARGMSNAAIADDMDLAVSSVKTHVGHLLAKLGVTDRVQLAVFAYENHVVQPGGTPAMAKTACRGGASLPVRAERWPR